MRTIEEIKAAIKKWDAMPMDEVRMFTLRSLRKELTDTIISGISLDRLEAICQAEKDGRCVVLFKPADSLKAEYSDGTEGYIPLKSMRLCEQGQGSEKGHGIKGSAGVSGSFSPKIAPIMQEVVDMFGLEGKK